MLVLVDEVCRKIWDVPAAHVGSQQAVEDVVFGVYIFGNKNEIVYQDNAWIGHHK